MVPLHITHIKRDGPDDGHVIDYYCGPGWAMEASLAIRQYKAGQRFFTYEGGKYAKVVLGVSVAGRAYFRTEADQVRLNNLSRLPPPTLLGNAFAELPKRRTLLG